MTAVTAGIWRRMGGQGARTVPAADQTFGILQARLIFDTPVGRQVAITRRMRRNTRTRPKIRANVPGQGNIDRSRAAICQYRT